MERLRMRDGSTRVLTSGVMLAVLWVVVYWWWQPGPRAVPLAAPEGLARGDGPGVSPAGVVDPTLRAPEAGSPASENTERVARGEGPPPRLPEAKPTRAPVVSDATGAVLVPPAFREVTVQRGDTFGSIARRELGDAALWTVIARSNPGVDPNRLRPGVAVRVPVDPSNIQGRVVDAAPAGAPEPEAAEPPLEVEYTVRSGDTLSSIAQKFYGSVRYVDLLYGANRDRLRSKDDLRLGQVLRVPPRPAED